MGAYARGELCEALAPLPSCHRIIAIGSDRMMAAVQQARHGKLAPYFRKDHVAIASINSPMQYRMKEICAQCLQRHIDPTSGKETIIFSCSNHWKSVFAALGISDATQALERNGCVEWGRVPAGKGLRDVGHARCNEPTRNGEVTNANDKLETRSCERKSLRHQ